MQGCIFKEASSASLRLSPLSPALSPSLCLSPFFGTSVAASFIHSYAFFNVCPCANGLLRAAVATAPTRPKSVQRPFFFARATPGWERAQKRKKKKKRNWRKMIDAHKRGQRCRLLLLSASAEMGDREGVNPGSSRHPPPSIMKLVVKYVHPRCSCVAAWVGKPRRSEWCPHPPFAPPPSSTSTRTAYVTAVNLGFEIRYLVMRGFLFCTKNGGGGSFSQYGELVYMHPKMMV